MIDEIYGEIDKRKVSKLVDNGVISAEELASAPIVLECPKCKQHQDPYNEACENCGEDIS
jgi:predicted amidophosphoribosyltransferase